MNRKQKSVDKQETYENGKGVIFTKVNVAIFTNTNLHTAQYQMLHNVRHCKCLQEVTYNYLQENMYKEELQMY